MKPWLVADYKARMSDFLTAPMYVSSCMKDWLSPSDVKADSDAYCLLSTDFCVDGDILRKQGYRGETHSVEETLELFPTQGQVPSSQRTPRTTHSISLSRPA